MKRLFPRIPSAGRAVAIALGSFAILWFPLESFRSSQHVIPDWVSNAVFAALVAVIGPLMLLMRERAQVSAAMNEGERQFRRIAEASPAGILHMRPDGLPLYANRRWTELSGGDLSDRDRQSWLDIVHPEDRHMAEATARRVGQEIVPATLLLRLAQSADDGGEAVGELRIHPEYHDGAVEGLVARMLDVTERHRAKTALAKREMQYRFLTENMGDLIIRLDQDGTIRFASLAARRELGVNPDSLIGKPLGSIVSNIDHAMLETMLGELVASGHNVSAQLRLEGQEGRPIWFEGQFRKVAQADGDDQGIVVSMRNIQARHEAEEREGEAVNRLRESNRVLRMAERMAEIEHWSVDGQSGRIEGSEGVRALATAGIDKATLVLSRLSPTDRIKLLRLAVRARQGRRAEAVIALDDGESVRTVRLAARADDAKTGHEGDLFGVARDITAERAAECELIEARDVARAAAHARANFLAAMSHEIRTPMTGVLGMIDLLRTDPHGPDSERYMVTLKQSADLLMAVLDDILDFEKIESGALKLEERDVDLETLVQSSVELFSNSASRKGLLLKFDGKRDDLTLVRADPVRLKQVLCNLISNAIKFTDKGSVQVRLRALEPDSSSSGPEEVAAGQSGDAPQPPRHRMRFEVSDTGTGLDPDVAAKLFEPFVQADASIARRFGGTGLGLAISRRLVEAMGGTMRAEGAPGKGATFSFEIDFPAGQERALAESVRKADWTRMPAMRILVAEDNPVNQMIIGAMLGRMGHEVVTVDDGRKAVDAAGETRFDAILMDMQMPELDGLAATRAIRASGGPSANSPIMALTADASPERRRFYDGAGLTDFLTKPIDRALLGARLAAIVEERGVQESGRRADDDSQDDAVAVLAADGGVEPSAVQSPTGTAPSIFDRDRLNEIKQALGEERCSQLLALLADECREKPPLLHADQDARDHGRLRADAHALKGAALNVGAIALGEAAQRLEHSRPADPSEEIEAMLITLDEAAEKTLKEIRNGKALFTSEAERLSSADPLSGSRPADGGAAARISDAQTIRKAKVRAG